MPKMGVAGGPFGDTLGGPFTQPCEWSTPNEKSEWESHSSCLIYNSFFGKREPPVHSAS